MVWGLATSPVLSQSYDFGDFKVSNIRVDAAATYVTLSPAPPACGGGTVFGAHLGIQHSRANYQSLFSMVLTAYTTGDRISGIWFNYASAGTVCSNANWLDVYMLQFAPKA